MSQRFPVTLSSHARRWAVELTEQKSVTGTDGEAAFGPWLAGELRRETAFRNAEVWTIEIGPRERPSLRGDAASRHRTLNGAFDRSLRHRWNQRL